MNLEKCITERRSIRKFQDDKVPFTCIEKAVAAAVYAPSWKNTQVTRYYAVTSEEVKQKVVEALPSFNKPAAKSAPVLMVVTTVNFRSGYNKEGQWETSKGAGWQMYDCGASNMLFCLAARSQGLGTVIMGYFDEDMIEVAINIPDSEDVTAVIAVGYPDEEPVMPKRKGTDIILKEI